MTVDYTAVKANNFECRPTIENKSHSLGDFSAGWHTLGSFFNLRLDEPQSKLLKEGDKGTYRGLYIGEYCRGY